MTDDRATAEALSDYVRILKLTDQHDERMSGTLNLIASENVPSPSILRVLASDFNNRVAEGWLGERCFPGIQAYDAIEEIGIRVAQELFGFDFVDLRPISGTIANAAIFAAFTEPGDTIFSPTLRSGAHSSMSASLPRKVFRLQVRALPFDCSRVNIDVGKAVALLRSAEPKPKLVFLGGSVLLYPQPVKSIADAAHEVGALVVYDASHVAGLIAGGLFQDPASEGADIVTFTTCKTIPGPQGGVILSKPEHSELLKRAVFPSLHSGHHLHEAVAKVLAFLEVKAFGREYAIDTIASAQRLGEELAGRELPVCGRNGGPFTQSHTLLIDCARWGGGAEVERALEMANILVNRNTLPTAADGATNQGVRLGTQEMTHLGMGQKEMPAVAEFFKRVLVDGEPPLAVREDVAQLRKVFQSTAYGFENKLLS